MSDPERPHLVPNIRRARHNEGYEIEFERINRFGERSSSLCVGELSLDDLLTLEEALTVYLDNPRNME